MNGFIAAAVGAGAVVVVPLVAWFSQRLTREGRLLLRIDRLGRALALMPASTERDQFEPHVRRATADLNRWLDPENRRVRSVQRLITWGLGVLAVVVLTVVISAFRINDLAVTISLGLAAGVVVSAVNIPLGLLVERSSKVRADE